VRTGARLFRPGVARALRAIAAGGRRGFYGGEFGTGLLALGGGEFAPADLDAPLAEWVTPLAAEAWGRILWTVPPPSQGYLTLAAARRASADPLPSDPDDPRWPAALVDATIAAGRHRPAVLHEAADGAALIRGGGHTTALCVVDADGTGVSIVQSNASGFGSHLFEPSTAINLHNRGIGFSLEPGHPAEYGPGRRPPHTLAPATVSGRDGHLEAVMGTQGGDGQPHILLQVIARLFAADQGPGDAVAAPRFVLAGTGQGFDTWTAPGGPTVVVEETAPPGWAAELAARGHRVIVGAAFDHGFGHVSLVVADDGGWAGASDPRARIGAAAGW
jgi:gamma-glutamyltranspeptidase/glutathione hydrolase